jgi:hypothetical protein
MEYNISALTTLDMVAGNLPSFHPSKNWQSHQWLCLLFGYLQHIGTF